MFCSRQMENTSPREPGTSCFARLKLVVLMLLSEWRNGHASEMHVNVSSGKTLILKCSELIGLAAIIEK